MNGETQYLQLLENILKNGQRKSNRTGVDTLVIPPTMIQHDMSRGFPLLTTKDVAFKPIRTELEFFIKGLTDKRWLQERGNHIWDEWANPKVVDKIMKTVHMDLPLDEMDKREEYMAEIRKETQREEHDLGQVYGAQWRNFNGQGYDQLKTIVNSLHTNPNDRRMLCSAWNPLVLDEVALPPCHYSWQVSHINGTLHLTWNQRSVDSFLGLPFNLASYALLLHLLCLEGGFKEGTVTGFLSDVHIYENHIEQVKEQISRIPYQLPTIETTGFTNIFDWDHTMTKSIGYQRHPKIVGEVAV